MPRNICVVTIEKIECIAEANEDQGTSSDEVYFGFGYADSERSGYHMTPTQENVDTGDTFSFSTLSCCPPRWEPFQIYYGDVEGPLQFHIQAWEEDNGKSPVRQDTAKILGGISRFLLLRNQKGGRPGTQKGAVAGMWNFVAGVTGIAELILNWMEDDFIGESTLLFPTLPSEDKPSYVQSVEVGQYYWEEDIFGNRRIRSVDGAYRVHLRLSRFTGDAGPDGTRQISDHAAALTFTDESPDAPPTSPCPPRPAPPTESEPPLTTRG
ncbi:hypothetical protein [Streptomyces badius]|uniref:Uncharacterized protein n=1 Tax=Streptomyces badius TaxID=1941 RepID=A0ABQ2TN91_STRBA|nr:hypothetical protein [Streptomyces badius]GGS80079.1 hypothetical protein GCM10010253_63500 [Streptomyces badius]